MKRSMLSWRLFVVPALAAVLATAGAPRIAHATVEPPLALPGPYAVECSNVAQDFDRRAPGEDVQLYWEGVPRANGTPRNTTDLLSEPANTLSVTVNAPNNSGVYGSFAGRAIPYVVVVCHPTTAANPRPDYSLPTGRTVPHMQRGSELPLWPDATTRYPVLLFSHGYGGSPLSNDYIYALTVFASFGYVVAAPFHTDATFSDLQLESIDDVFYLLTHLQDYLAMQALRPLALSATIDLLLAQPQWRDRVDSAQIGGFGASMGGESMLLMAGAGLTTSIGQSWSQITYDARLKAAVGYVPYLGQFVFPAFGRGEHGLDGVTLSYLAISGTADTTAPITESLQSIARLAGPRELVALTGVKHGFDVASTADIFTWSVTYLDAEVRGARSCCA
jgi:predicted dienelactone hydrolase